MTVTIDGERWGRETDDAVSRFLDRAKTAEWQAQPGDLADSPAAPWCDPDHPDPVLDAAYRAGIVPPAERRASDFTFRPIPLPDAVTILRTVDDKRLAKIVRGIAPADILDYDRAFRFNMARRHVRDLDDIGEMLGWLAGQSNRGIVRGDIVGPTRDVRRLLHPDGDDAATLTEVTRRWVAIDLDCEPDPAGSLVDCARTGIALLPKEFHECECVCQATASHRIKPGLRIRLWFWLSRAVGTAELKYWFRDAPVDPSIFTAAQITYTAAPIFESGAADPVPERMVRIAGHRNVPVPDVLRPPARKAPPPRPGLGVGLDALGKHIIVDACAKIHDAPQGRRDITLMVQARRVGHAVREGHIDERLAHDMLFASALPALDESPKEIEAKIHRHLRAGMGEVAAYA
jgi:hypothetical protein